MKYKHLEAICFKLTTWLILILGLIVCYAIFLLVSTGLYNPFFRVNFWLDTESWQNNSHLTFDVLSPSCTRFSINLNTNKSSIEGDCTPLSMSWNLPFNPNYVKTLQLLDLLGNPTQALTSPDDMKTAAVVERVEEPLSVHKEYLYVIEDTTGEIVYKSNSTNLLRLLKVRFLIFSITIGALEKITLVLIVILISLHTWQMVRFKPRRWKKVLWLILPIFVLTFCYSTSVIAYGFKWLNT